MLIEQLRGSQYNASRRTKSIAIVKFPGFSIVRNPACWPIGQEKLFHLKNNNGDVMRLRGFILAGLLCSSLPAFATTYYVRSDGGLTSQCNGLADAPYPGAGSNQPCAWASPMVALPPTDAPLISGGDTLIIGEGEYQIGLGGLGSNTGRCHSSYPWDCHMAAIPSGLSPTQKTRILGKRINGKCSVAPVLWGNERVSRILNLQKSSNVEIDCLEITDKSDCVEMHSNTEARCQRNSFPYGKWASVGIYAAQSQNISLTDVNIHGLANAGVHAGLLSNWQLQRVKINANGWVGWNGDIGEYSSNTGRMSFQNVEIAWNGCGQRWQTGEAWACWGQEGGGYGDGLGTGKTGGEWVFEDSFIHHNTSDGLDLLYMDGSPLTSVTIRRMYAASNAGNQIKTRGKTVLENSVVIGECGYFDGKFNMLAGDQCRAMGNTLSLALVNGQESAVRHNTITGQGDCLVLSSGGDNTSSLLLQNNAFVGQGDFLAGRSGYPESTCLHYADASSARVQFDRNWVSNVKYGACPAGSTCGSDPLLRSSALTTFDANPLASSPLLNKAITSDIQGDFYGTRRDSLPDLGAVELTEATTPGEEGDSCVRQAPTLSISPQVSANAGVAATYTLVLRNNDSAACPVVKFQLAHSIPLNWTGSLSSSSMELTSGQSGQLTLSVTSSANAAAGSYPIGVGVSSSSGDIHKQSNASFYEVTARSEEPAMGFSNSIGTNKAVYQKGEVVHLSSRVMKNGAPLAGAKVHFIVDNPSGVRTIKYSTTDSQGYARTKYTVGTRQTATGEYWTRADAFHGANYHQALTSFRVR